MPDTTPTLILTLAVALLVSGCVFRKSDPAPDEPQQPAARKGGWFCQMAESGDAWDCIQDETLAANPRPTRLPAARPATPERAPATPVPDPLDDLQPAPPRVPSPVADTAPAPAPAPTPAPPSRAPDAEAPKHVRLAYQPPQPVALVDLPPDFWTVQLVAVSSREQLEAYAEQHDIRGMSAARVERGGKLYFVLLLGVYETYEAAAEAATDMPPPFHEHEPWIRQLGGLQEAMHAGDRLAAGLDPRGAEPG